MPLESHFVQISTPTNGQNGLKLLSVRYYYVLGLICKKQAESTALSLKVRENLVRNENNTLFRRVVGIKSKYVHAE